MQGTLTFSRHDSKPGCPKGYFELIEQRFTEALLPTKASGTIDIYRAEAGKGTHHKKEKGVTVKPSLNNRTILGACQPGENKTCFNFRAIIGGDLDPEKVHQALLAKPDRAMEETPQAKSVSIILSLTPREPDQPTLDSSFWSPEKQSLLYSMIEAARTPNGQIPFERVVEAIKLVAESESGYSPITLTDDQVKAALMPLVTSQRIYPQPKEGVVRHFTLTPETTTAATVRVAANSKDQSKDQPPVLQAARNPVVTKQVDPKGSGRKESIFSDLFENEQKLKDLEVELLKCATGDRTINRVDTVSALSRYLHGKGIDTNFVSPDQLGGGILQLVRRKFLIEIGQDKGYRIKSPFSLKEASIDQAMSKVGTFTLLFKDANHFEAMMNGMEEKADKKSGLISYDSARKVLKQHAKAAGIAVGKLNDYQIGQGLAFLSRYKHLTPVGSPSQRLGYFVTRKLSRTSPVLDRRETERAIARFTGDEYIALIGDMLIRGQNRKNDFVSLTTYWEAVKTVACLPNGTPSEVLNAIHDAMRTRQFIEAGSRESVGVGYRMTNLLFVLVEQWKPQWAARESACHEEEKRNHAEQLRRGEEMARAIKELRGSDQESETKPASHQAPATKKASETPQTEEPQVMPKPAVDQTTTPPPADVSAADNAEAIIGSERSTDSPLTELEEEIIELQRELAEKTQDLHRMKTITEALSSNPDAAQAMKDMLASGNIDALKKICGLDN